MNQADCPSDYDELKRQITAFHLKSEESAVSPESTAKAVVEAIKAEHPKAVYRTTIDAKVAPVIRGLLGTTLFGNAIDTQIKK
jgi:hypothetical protein